MERTMKLNAVTVTDLNKYIKQKVDEDENLNSVLVKGEISNFKHHYTGHMYFTLKDENSLIKCIMFKSSASTLKFTPKDGMKVIVFGTVSVFERDGVYQIYCKSMFEDGMGDLHTAYEELKAKLEPVDEHDDVKEIEEVLKNLDEEIDAYINANDFTKNKVEWLISHTKRIEVVKPAKRVTHYIIELDLLAGAIIAGKDFQLFVHTKAPLRVQNTESKVSAEIRFVA
jgi:hypothetical protein